MRNLKMLGLALAAMFAVSAVGASAAMAWEFHSGAAHTIIKGEQVAANGDVFNVDGGETRCPEASYDGTTTTSTTKEITITPTYPTESCELKLGGFTVGKVHINMNSCDYLFTAETTDPEGNFEGSADIKCTTPGDSITVVATSGGVTKCTVHIPEQTDLTKVTFDNVAGSPTHIKVTVNITNITYVQTAGSGFGACSTPAGHTTNGTYKGEATTKGFDTENHQVSVSVA